MTFDEAKMHVRKEAETQRSVSDMSDSKARAIAEKCWTRIAANDGFFDQEYMTQCIEDAIKETVIAVLGELLGDDSPDMIRAAKSKGA